MNLSVKTVLFSLLRAAYDGLLSSRVRLKGDIGQSKIRFVIVLVSFAYCLLCYIAGSDLNGNFLALTGLLVAYLGVTASYLWWAWRNPRTFVIRRILAITSDNLVLAIGFALVGQIATPLFFFLVWATLLNGLRFGINYLIYSALVGMLCLLGLYQFDDYWHQHSTVVWACFSVNLLISIIGCALAKKRMREREDTEHEQAFVRLVVSTVYLLYFSFFWITAEVGYGGLVVDPFFVAMMAVMASIVIFLSILIKPGVSETRRVLGMFVDLGATTYVLANTGEIGAPMLGVYLWVTMGNGFRFGLRNLNYCAIVSVVGFAAVVALNPFWRENIVISLSFMLLLLVLSASMAMALKKVNQGSQLVGEFGHANMPFSTSFDGAGFGVNYFVYLGLLSLVCVVAVFGFSEYWRSEWITLFVCFVVVLSAIIVGCFLQVKKLKNRKDSEHEQAFIRVIITTIFFVYFGVLWKFSGDAALIPGFEALFYASTAVVIASLMIFLSISLRPGKSLLRRFLGMFLDIGAATFALVQGGEFGAPMLAVYLWVSMGNGFRYGVPYLFVSAFLSLVGFVIMAFYVPFWKEHVYVSMSIVMVLLALPLYMASLIKKLRNAISQANQANKAKTQFLANMSHELRTPLNAVIGISDLLMDANINEYQRRLATRIQSSANLLLGVIEHILDISKIETGKIELQRRAFDLYALLHDLVGVFEVQADSKGLTFDIVVSTNVPITVVGDENRLKQILVNLLGNACKFTTSGGVTFRVFARSDLHGKAIISFEVEDTGIGIPEETQQSIFEPFVQADDSVTREYGGTGLGMSISKQLVEAMGGQISVLSQLNMGSTFTVELPFASLTEPRLWEQEEPMRALRVVVLNQKNTSSHVVSDLMGWGVQTWSLFELAQIDNLFAQIEQKQPKLLIIDEADWQSDKIEAAVMALPEETRQSLQLGLLVANFNAQTVKEYTAQGVDWVIAKPLQRKSVTNVAHYMALKHAPADNVISLAEHYASKQGKKLRVLVSEDNKLNQMVIKEVLSKVGHLVTLVEDGEQALDALEAQAFDLAIIDFNMPKVSGLEVIKICRFRQDLRNMPIIVLSADATTETHNECKEAGADEFLTKPFNAKHLLGLIAKLSGAVKPAMVNTAGGSGNVVQVLEEIVDFQVLNQLIESGLDNDFVDNLVQEFFQQGERLLPVIRSTLQEGDVLAAADSAHVLKGSAAYLGATRLEKLCEQTESLSKGKPSINQGMLLDNIDAVFQSTCAILADYIKDRH